MARVLLAIGDIGLAMPFQEALEAGGHQVSWTQAAADGPEHTGKEPHELDVVVLGSDGSSELADVIAAYRGLDPMPALIVVADSEADAATAQRLHTACVPASASSEALRSAVTHALEHRYASGLSLAMARGALGVEAFGDERDQMGAVVRSARKAEITLVQEALRWHPQHYVTATDVVAELREDRVLQVPEVELVKKCDGTLTLQSLVRTGVMEPAQAARVVWGLASVGALRFTEGPPDPATPGRRAVYMTRMHLQARTERLDASTYYDVLELTPSCNVEDIEHSVSLLARRYSPEAIGHLDLAELAGLAAPLWEQILKARATLSDISTRGRYNDWLQKNGGSLHTVWAVGRRDSQRAEEAHAKGQAALIAGDAHAALSHMAAAARAYPDHPDYECALLWAKFRSAIARGVERDTSLADLRAHAEELNLGVRPWPRALVVLALLCAADSDSGAARWHVREALSIDPSLPAARKLWDRLG